MLLRCVLVILLPLLAAGSLTEKQRQMVQYVEDHYGACILHGTGCVDESFTYARIAMMVDSYRQLYPSYLPSECSCPASSERCNRVCYLALLKKFYADSVSSKRSTRDLTDKQREMIQYVEERYGPCILHGKDCPDDSFTYAKIAQIVAGYRQYYTSYLPKECDCDSSSERCNRVCYLAVMKKVYAASANRK